jgi:hypothetical protein
MSGGDDGEHPRGDWVTARGVIWDLDGVLANTGEALRLAPERCVVVEDAPQAWRRPAALGCLLSPLPPRGLEKPWARDPCSQICNP